jgi:hypothetical protein
MMIPSFLDVFHQSTPLIRIRDGSLNPMAAIQIIFVSGFQPKKNPLSGWPDNGFFLVNYKD